MGNRILYGLMLTGLLTISRSGTSQVSHYGFESLFSQQQFNENFPFNHSVHPEAWGFIQDYLRKNEKNLKQMKTWALPYFTLIENVMSQYNLPKELKYLAVIESGLNTHALSWAGARGPWQLMPETARQFGLEVNRWNDERTDYFRSTHAAAKLLSQLYSDYRDWLLVIAAYNGGSGRVNAAIKKSNSRNFWKLQLYLPEESRMHVKKFIATHYMMQENPTDDLKNLQAESGRTDSIEPGMSVQEIAGKFSSVVIAKHLLIDLNYFNYLNPDFDQTLGENKVYRLKLPSDKMEKFNANRYTILSESVQLILRFYGNDPSTNHFPEISEVPDQKKKKSGKKNQ
jgi:membrane-bound lytic murein transglycosylase D